MKAKLLFLSPLLLVCALFMLASCRDKHTTVAVGSGHVHSRGHGPPPHAPAHGYRRKHYGADIIYDSAWGVYVVVGLPSHYYHEGHYYRHQKTHWEAAAHINGPWKAVSYEGLPQGVRGKHAYKGKPKERGSRGRGAQKKKIKY